MSNESDRKLEAFLSVFYPWLLLFLITLASRWVFNFKHGEWTPALIGLSLVLSSYCVNTWAVRLMGLRKNWINPEGAYPNMFFMRAVLRCRYTAMFQWASMALLTAWTALVYQYGMIPLAEGFVVSATASSGFVTIFAEVSYRRIERKAAKAEGAK